jgi:hypothetical protein
VREQQPAFIELDWRPAIANLNKLPGKFPPQNNPSAFPGVQVVRIDQFSGVSRNEMKSLVSINSERIARPL